jgi:hypothetical protein
MNRFGESLFDQTSSRLDPFAMIMLDKYDWLFRYWITASIHVHFQPFPHESSSYSSGYGHAQPAL